MNNEEADHIAQLLNSHSGYYNSQRDDAIFSRRGSDLVASFSPFLKHEQYVQSVLESAGIKDYQVAEIPSPAGESAGDTVEFTKPLSELDYNQTVAMIQESVLGHDKRAIEKMTNSAADLAGRLSVKGIPPEKMAELTHRWIEAVKGALPEDQQSSFRQALREKLGFAAEIGSAPSQRRSHISRV